MQNVVIRGKKADGSEKPVLVDSDGKIETTATITGDITIGEVEVSNFPATQPISGEVTVHDIEGGVVDTVTKVNAVDSITNKINIDTIDHLTSITNPVDVVYVDEYGWETENTPQGESRSVTPYRLVGAQFAGTTVDTNFWTAATGTGGTVSQANQLLTMSNGATAGNDVSITSVRRARYLGGSTNRFRANFAFGDTGAAGNVRRIGAYDANNGFFLELNGTTLNFVIRKAAGDTTIAQAAWDDSTFTIDTNIHTLEIYWTNKSVWISLDGELKHKVSASTSSLVGDINLPITIENNNSGAATSKNFYITNAVIHRLGAAESENTSKYISGASAGTVCKLSAGKLKRVVFHPGANGNVCQLYDSPSTTANQIGELAGDNQPTSFTAEFDVPFHNGLYVVTTGTGTRVTVVYE